MVSKLFFFVLEIVEFFEVLCGNVINYVENLLFIVGSLFFIVGKVLMFLESFF